MGMDKVPSNSDLNFSIKMDQRLKDAFAGRHADSTVVLENSQPKITWTEAIKGIQNLQDQGEVKLAGFKEGLEQNGERQKLAEPIVNNITRALAKLMDQHAGEVHDKPLTVLDLGFDADPHIKINLVPSKNEKHLGRLNALEIVSPDGTTQKFRLRSQLNAQEPQQHEKWLAAIRAGAHEDIWMPVDKDGQYLVDAPDFPTVLKQNIGTHYGTETIQKMQEVFTPIEKANDRLEAGMRIDSSEQRLAALNRIYEQIYRINGDAPTNDKENNLETDEAAQQRHNEMAEEISLQNEIVNEVLKQIGQNEVQNELADISLKKESQNLSDQALPLYEFTVDPSGQNNIHILLESPGVFQLKNAYGQVERYQLVNPKKLTAEEWAQHKDMIQRAFDESMLHNYPMEYHDRMAAIQKAFASAGNQSEAQDINILIKIEELGKLAYIKPQIHEQLAIEIARSSEFQKKAKASSVESAVSALGFSVAQKQ